MMWAARQTCPACLHASNPCTALNNFMPAPKNGIYKWRMRQVKEPNYKGGLALRMHVKADASAAVAPMIQDGWGLWAVLSCCAAGAQVASHTRWGAALSTPLMSMSAGILLAAAGVLPSDCASYDVVWQYLMPLAAACFLLETDMSQLVNTGGPTLAAFLIGAVGMVIGAVVSYALVSSWMGQHGSKLAACLCASYVGGSVNFASVAKAVSLPASLVPAAMAADNLAMTVFLAILSSVPSEKGVPTHHINQQQDASSHTSIDHSCQGIQQVTATSLACTFATAATSCALGKQIATNVIGVPSLHLMFMAVIAACASTALQRLSSLLAATSNTPATNSDGMFAGAAQLGSCLMALFFVIIGCSAGCLSSLARPETLAMFCFLMIMVSTHWAVLFIVNKFLCLPMSAVVLGSNANVGGPATAAALAASKGWTGLVQPSMLSGSLGYAIGTMAGLTVAHMLGLPLLA